MDKKHNRLFTVILMLLILSQYVFYLSCEKKNLPVGVKKFNGFINDSNDYIEQDIDNLKSDKIGLPDKFGLKFSHNNFFYTADIEVELSTALEGADIYYTKNGSEPTKATGKKYEKPIKIFAEADNECTTIKAVAIKGEEESQVKTHTYFVSKLIPARFSEGTYVFSISSDSDNFYGYENGILVEGKLRDDWQKENRRKEPIPPDPANFNIRGREGERECWVEIIKSDGECVVSQGIGVRVHGGWSRAANKKSLALYSRDEYDPDFDAFRYDFFGSKRRNDEFSTFKTSFKNLLLRNGGNDRDGAFIREELSQSLACEAGFIDYHATTPAAVFLNGQYYGFFWLQEFYDETYITDTYDKVDKEYIEIGEWEEPKIGNILDDEEYKRYCEIMDIDNYTKYYAFQIYTGNRDWPQNNKKFWRFKGEGGTDYNKYYDGKFRMLLYDDEMGWGMYGAGYREQTIKRIKTDNSSQSFIKLIRREDFVEKYCNQMFDLMNSVFVYENVIENLDYLIALYDNEVTRMIKENFTWQGEKGLENEQKSIRSFAQRRYVMIVDDMYRSLRLDSDETYRIHVSGAQGSAVTLNTLETEGANMLSSEYFAQHRVKISAIPFAGYKFSHWEINGVKYETSEILLDRTYGINGTINAVLFVTHDNEYKDFVINKVKNGTDGYIELKNIGSNEYKTEELYLSDAKGNLKKYKIGKINFPPKSSITFYSKDYSAKIDKEYLLPFRITNTTNLYISDKNGNIVKEIKLNDKINVNETIIYQNYGSYKTFN